MAVKAKKKSSGYGSQIGAESTLRFNPERTALQQALGDAIAQRDQEIGAARGAAQGSVQVARAAIPAVNRVTQDAIGQISGAMASVPAAAPDLARTQGALASRMALATGELAARQTGATAGFQYAVNQSTGRAAENAGKIRDRLAALGVERGAFEQGRLAELLGEATKQDFTAGQNALDRTSREGIAKGYNDTSLAVAGDKTRAKTLATPDDHQMAALSIKDAIAFAKAAKERGKSRSETAAALTRDLAGTNAKPLYESDSRGVQRRVLWQDGDPEVKAGQEVAGTPRVIPGAAARAATKPLLASVALDVAYDGGVSAQTVRRLHNPQKRYSVKELAASVGFQTQTQRERSGALRPKPKPQAVVPSGVFGAPLGPVTLGG